MAVPTEGAVADTTEDMMTEPVVETTEDIMTEPVEGAVELRCDDVTELLRIEPAPEPRLSIPLLNTTLPAVGGGALLLDALRVFGERAESLGLVERFPAEEMALGALGVICTIRLQITLGAFGVGAIKLPPPPPPPPPRCCCCWW